MNDPNQPYGPINSVNLSQNNQNAKHSYRMILVTVIVLLIAIGGIVVSRNEYLQQVIKGKKMLTPSPQQGFTQDGQPQSTQVDIVASSINDRSTPWMEVISDGGQATVGQPLNLFIQAGSNGRDVTGYDLLLAFDRRKFDVVSVTSELPDYQIFQFDRGNHITVTGIKDFQKKEPVIYDSANILKVVLTPKQSGTAVVTLLPNNGKEKTQMVDPNVTVMEPQIGSLQLEVQ